MSITSTKLEGRKVGHRGMYVEGLYRSKQPYYFLTFQTLIEQFKHQFFIPTHDM